MNETTALAAETDDARSSIFEPPGGVLVWIIVFVETFTFAAGLAAFALSRRDEPAVFAAGSATLAQPLALANTLVLLTGGWMMASALTCLRRGGTGAPARAARWMDGAIASGAVFLAIKSVEYATKLSHGLGLHHDTFFTYYWLLTIFHCLHVMVAVVILVVMRRTLAKGRVTEGDHANVEGAGVFWHMCDLIWLLLYPTIYLLR